jgi:hypothetical protein
MMLSSQTQGKLLGLKSRVKFLFLVEGLAIVLLLLCGAVLVTLGLDFLLRGPALFRLFLDLIALGMLAYCTYRFLAYPLMVRMSIDDMALFVEKGYPGLKDSLISALQLSRKFDPSDTYSSSAMVEALVNQTEQTSARMNFGRVVGPTRNMTSFMGACVLALAIVAGSFYFVPNMLRMFVQRIILLTDEKYPEPWMVQVDNAGEIEFVPQQSDVTINVTVAHTGDAGKDYASPLYIEYRVMEDNVEKLRSKKVEKDPGSKNHFTFKIPGVSNDVQYTIKGSGVQDYPGTIKVVPRPEILKTFCVVTPPPYTGLPYDTPPVEDLSVLRGSNVEMGIKTSRPVSGAYIIFTKGKLELQRRVHFGPSRGAPDDRTLCTASFVAEGSMTLKIILQDAQFPSDERFRNLKPAEYNLNVRTDAAPRVEMLTPTRANIKKVEKAFVIVRYHAEDDLYPARVILQYEVIAPKVEAGQSPPQGGLQNIELYDLLKDRWIIEGGDPLNKYLPSLQTINDGTYSFNLGRLPIQSGSRVAMRLLVVDGMDLRHAEAAQPILEDFALRLSNARQSIADLWSPKRINMPEDVRDRMVLLMYDGLIRTEKNLDKVKQYEQERATLFATVMNNLIANLQAERSKAVDEERKVDVAEYDAKIAKAYYDIVRIDPNKSQEEVETARKVFEDAVSAFKDSVKRNIIFFKRDSAWALIGGEKTETPESAPAAEGEEGAAPAVVTLITKARDYYDAAVAADLTKEAAGDDVKSANLAIQAEFKATADALRGKRQEIYNELLQAHTVSMAGYIKALNDLVLPTRESGHTAFRDDRALEDLEQERMDSPPADDTMAEFMLYAKMYAKVEQEIARQLQYIDMLQCRTGELIGEDFAAVWGDLGMYDSLDLNAMRVIVEAKRFEEDMKRQNVDEKIAELNGRISELTGRIQKYCEENGLSDEEPAAPAPAPGTTPPPAAPPADAGSSAPLFLDPPAPEAGEGGAAPPPAGEGTGEAAPPAEGTGEAAPPAGEGPAAESPAPESEGGLINIVDDETLEKAREMRRDLRQQRDDLQGCVVRYEVYASLADSIKDALNWVGPNVTQTEVLQLNIVDTDEKISEMLGSLIELGERIKTDVRAAEEMGGKGAYDRFMYLSLALETYLAQPNAAQSEGKLLAVLKAVYPDEAVKFDADFVNEQGVIKVDAVKEEIGKRKARELGMAWLAQKSIEKALPEITAMAREIVEEFRSNNFPSHPAVNDLVSLTPVKDADEKVIASKGVIPILDTLRRVLIPELARITDDMQRIGDEEQLKGRITNIAIPKEQQVIELCNQMQRLIDKYGSTKEIIERIRKLIEHQRKVLEWLKMLELGEISPAEMLVNLGWPEKAANRKLDELEQSGLTEETIKQNIATYKWMELPAVEMLRLLGWPEDAATKKVQELEQSGLADDQIKKNITAEMYPPPAAP